MSAKLAAFYALPQTVVLIWVIANGDQVDVIMDIMSGKEKEPYF